MDSEESRERIVETFSGHVRILHHSFVALHSYAHYLRIFPLMNSYSLSVTHVMLVVVYILFIIYIYILSILFLQGSSLLRNKVYY